jgi:hypothetical protein
MWSWRNSILLMLGLNLLACQAAAPSVNYSPASAPMPEALNLQGNTARENKDYAEAMRLYRQAADMGDAMSMNNIGWLYQHGWGVPSDYGEALRWYRQAAETGATPRQWTTLAGCTRPVGEFLQTTVSQTENLYNCLVFLAFSSTIVDPGAH